MALLIQADELARIVDDSLVVVADCRYQLNDSCQGYLDYRQGHIPGAHYVSLSEHMSGPGPASAGRHPLPSPEQFAGLLAEMGITVNHQVVAYDDTGGQMAARFWWLCRWLGVDRVALLDGGWQAWAGRFSVSTDDVGRPGTGSVTPKVRSHILVDVGALRSGLGDGSLCVLDARAGERFRAEVEPIDPVAGHMPGAINHPFSLNLDSENRFLSVSRLREQYLSAINGFAPDQVVHSCGSGVTACHNLFAMELAGLTQSRLFAPSWSGWIVDTDNPVAP